MRRTAIVALAALAGAAFAAQTAEAQTRRVVRGPVVVREVQGPLVIRVQPRSFLNAGTVVKPGSLIGTTPTMAFQQTFQNIPSAYEGKRDLFGEGVLPDRLTGPYVGSRRDALSRIDFSATLP